MGVLNCRRRKTGLPAAKPRAARKIFLPPPLFRPDVAPTVGGGGNGVACGSRAEGFSVPGHESIPWKMTSETYMGK